MTNKEKAILKDQWRNEVNEIMAMLRQEEASRSRDERDALSKQDFLLEHATERLCLADLTDDELVTKRTWMNKRIYGSTPSAHPDAPLLCDRFEAWPVGAVPEWFVNRTKARQYCYDAFARQIQHQIGLIRSDIARLYAKAYKSIGVEEVEATAEQRDQIVKMVSSTIKTEINFKAIPEFIRKARIVFLVADKGEIPTDGWNIFNSNFVRMLTTLPIYVQRQLGAQIKRSPNKHKWDEGYPRPSINTETDVIHGNLDIYFNGQSLTWNDGPQKNSYVEISSSINPPDHHGPRAGYRSFRTIRQVTIREPKSQNRITLNVLFHTNRSGARMKGLRLQTEKDPSGKLRWFFIPTWELQTPVVPDTRSYVGVDIGWRSKTGQFKGANAAFKVAISNQGGGTNYYVKFAATRWSVWVNHKDPSFPLEMSPAGLNDYQSRLRLTLDGVRTQIGDGLIAAGESLPNKFKHYTLRGLTLKADKLGIDISKFSTVYLRREKTLRIAWKKLVAERDKQYREIILKILNGATDVGIENLGVKQMAESDNRGKTDEEKGRENIARKNRQFLAPRRLLTLLTSMAKVRGIRVHTVLSEYTSNTCSYLDCGHHNDIGTAESFTCFGCNVHHNRDYNGATNIAQLARECSSSDIHPLACSHNGKLVPYHGLPGAGEAHERHERGNHKTRSQKSSKPKQNQEVLVCA